ncbi:methylmalonyl-CoA mutase [Bacillus sp. V33-4]|nr:methylmalonyl-CoA mutase [Bacillus sp. V33-4]
MMINEMKNKRFSGVTMEDWQRKAEQSLKGKTVDSLATNTYESIILKPLYSGENRNGSPSQYPGQPDFRRGINPLGMAANGWHIAQKITYTDQQDLRNKLEDSLKKGQTAVSFDVSKHVDKSLPFILDGIYDRYPFCINAKDGQSHFLNELLNLSGSRNENVTGYVGMDPVARLAETGKLPIKLESAYKNWAELIEKTDQMLPNLKTVLIDTIPVHNSGGNAVQELAVALATGSYHIQQLLENGINLEKILEKIVIKMAVGANFFMEVAKLRAARLLWLKVAEAFGAGPESGRAIIAAETSTFTKTVYDPYVNILRSGNEAFAAVLGGVQYLHVNPYNDPEDSPNSLAERIARNTQLLLKEESYLNKVADPAGGSWYIEHLTDELAQKAWEMFLEIDEKNGIAAVLRSGWLQEKVADVNRKRQEDIFMRKQSIIGTNVYANLQDVPLRPKAGFSIHDDGRAAEMITPLKKSRLAEPYEALRKRAGKIEAAQGAKALVGLICLGALKEYKGRADFVAGFLAPAGVHSHRSTPIDSIDDVYPFIEETAFSHYCLCGSNERYSSEGIETARLLKGRYPKLKLYLAGLPEGTEREEWRRAGIDEFIHMRSNCYAMLSAMLTEIEANDNEG